MFTSFCRATPRAVWLKPQSGRQHQPVGRRVPQAHPHAIGHIRRRFDVLAFHVDDADGHVHALRHGGNQSISANSRLAIST